MSIKRNILLNPGPATTTDSVKNALVVPDICPREREFGELMLSISRQLVEVVHGGDQYRAVLFAGSGTLAVEACISSVVPEGEKILVIDNGAYGKRMCEIAKTYRLDLLEYRIPWGDYPDLVEIEKLLQQHRGQVSHLAVVHHETTTGMLNPVDDMAALIHAYQGEIIVDAMSSFAGLPIDIVDQKLDYLISSSNKCIQGMAGLSFAICKVSALESASQITPKLFYSNLVAQQEYFQKNLQMRFTPPVQITNALDQALKEFFEEVERSRHERYTGSFRTLILGLEKLGFRFLLPEEQRSQLLVAVIEPDHPAYTFDAMHDFLYERGFSIYPGNGAKEKTFRLATIGQIFPGDIEDFLQVLNEYLKHVGIGRNLYQGM